MGPAGWHAQLSHSSTWRCEDWPCWAAGWAVPVSLEAAKPISRRPPPFDFKCFVNHALGTVSEVAECSGVASQLRITQGGLVLYAYPHPGPSPKGLLQLPQLLSRSGSCHRARPSVPVFQGSLAALPLETRVQVRGADGRLWVAVWSRPLGFAPGPLCLDHRPHSVFPSVPVARRHSAKSPWLCVLFAGMGVIPLPGKWSLPSICSELVWGPFGGPEPQFGE